uniref:Uncharacterized protein n=1 Tax=Rhizophora mucronata TaxID=61149 RepID=A0A2P2KKW4_RHIMU
MRTRAVMSLPFLPLSLVTTTFGAESEGEFGDDEDARILKFEG